MGAAFARQWTVARERARGFIEGLPDEDIVGSTVPIVIEVMIERDDEDENAYGSDYDVD